MTTHSDENFAVVEHPDEDYPGFDVLENFVQTECLGSFEPYVGVGALDSELFYSSLVPSLEAGTTPRTEIVCVLVRQDAALMTGSMRESNNGRAWPRARIRTERQSAPTPVHERVQNGLRVQVVVRALRRWTDRGRW